MKRLNDREKLFSYIERYELNKVFQENILEQMELFHFNKGELICSKDSELKYMFFLVEGKVKTGTLHDNGKSILLRFNHPLSIFGDVEILTNYRVLCNVECITESLLIGIDMDILRASACDDTTFLKFIIKNLSSKLYGISNSTSINLLYPLESRLASYLLSMAEEDSIVVSIPKLTEIAPLLGASYRHLNRTINELVSSGIIDKDKSTVTIKDMERLRELAQGNIYET